MTLHSPEPPWRGQRNGVRGTRFFVYLALLIFVPVVVAQVGYVQCTANESGEGDDSLCGLAYFVLGPFAFLCVLAVCAAVELVVRYRLRQAGELHGRGWFRLYWFELLCGLVALAVAVGVVLSITRPWEPDYTALVVAANDEAAANDEEVVALIWTVEEGWPPADASWAEAEALTGSGNHRFGPVYDEIIERRGWPDDDPSERCLYWPVVSEPGEDVDHAGSIVRKCFRSTRAGLRESSLSYARVRGS
jgi:hypothetical protein